MENTIRERIVSLQSHLMNFALRLTGNEEQASDLLQDTSLKALSCESQFSENINFKGWIFTIMRNIFINDYRKRARRNTVIDSSEDYYQLNLPQESGLSNPEGSIALKEILIAMRSMTDDYRIPFTLYVEGYKYAEISQRLQLPLGTVKSRIYLARRQLRNSLEDYQ